MSQLYNYLINRVGELPTFEIYRHIWQDKIKIINNEYIEIILSWGITHIYTDQYNNTIKRYIPNKWRFYMFEIIDICLTKNNIKIKYHEHMTQEELNKLDFYESYDE